MIPLEDVAYLAWSWCVASKPSRGPVDGQARQVRLVADAYGLARATDLLPALLRRLESNVDFWNAMRSHPRRQEFLDWTAREHAYLETHREVFAAALTGGDCPAAGDRQGEVAGGTPAASAAEAAKR